MKKKIIIYGISPAASQSHYDFTKDSAYEVTAFTVDAAEIKQNEFKGLPVVPFENVELQYPPSEYDMFVAIYFSRVNQTRRKKFLEAKEKGYTLASYVSSKAIVWPELAIGENCLISDGANIRPFTKIGNDTFIMSGAVVGHDAEVADHCYIAINATLLAGCSIDSCCVIGANSTILNGVVVAKECIISAGAVINKNTKEKGVYTLNEPTLLALPSDKLANILFKVQV